MKLFDDTISSFTLEEHLKYSDVPEFLHTAVEHFLLEQEQLIIDVVDDRLEELDELVTDRNSFIKDVLVACDEKETKDDLALYIKKLFEHSSIDI